jgi:hypothetical protein
MISSPVEAQAECTPLYPCNVKPRHCLCISEGGSRTGRFYGLSDGPARIPEHILTSGPLTAFDQDIVRTDAELAAQASDHHPEVVRLGL